LLIIPNFSSTAAPGSPLKGVFSIWVAGLSGDAQTAAQPAALSRVELAAQAQPKVGTAAEKFWMIGIFSSLFRR
jgi:hypothetical protein